MSAQRTNRGDAEGAVVVGRMLAQLRSADADERLKAATELHESTAWSGGIE
eukprot:SAG22_NODE_791_length_7210_cov_40.904936_1_plen_50_part_10